MRNWPPLDLRSGRMSLMYAAAASSGEMAVPPEDMEPSGSLKVRSWVEVEGSDFTCVRSAAMLLRSWISGINVRSLTSVEFPGSGDQFQYHDIPDSINRDQSATTRSERMVIPRLASRCAVVDGRVIAIRARGSRRRLGLEAVDCVESLILTVWWNLSIYTEELKL